MATSTKPNTNKTTGKKVMSVKDFIKTQMPQHDKILKKLADA